MAGIAADRGVIRADDRNAKAKPLSRRLPSLRRPCLMCRQIYTGPCPNTMTCGSPAPSVTVRRTFRETFKRRTVRTEVTPFIAYIRAISVSKKEKNKKNRTGKKTGNYLPGKIGFFRCLCRAAFVRQGQPDFRLFYRPLSCSPQLTGAEIKTCYKSTFFTKDVCANE